jgi:dipeptidyl aminopeptidase/acylaminoacyl peptidase
MQFIKSQLSLEQLAIVRSVGPGNWSKDGKQIAYILPDRNGKNFLWVTSTDGKKSHQLTDRSIHLEMSDGTDRRDVWGGPQWSPNDGRVAFLSASSSGKGTSVWTVDSYNGETREISKHFGIDRTPRWSTNGVQIGMVVHRNGRDDIHIVPSSGGTATQMTFGQSDNTDLSWSPDDSQIAFISQVSEIDVFSNNLCLLSTGDGKVVQITHGDRANDRTPRWSPDGKQIAFISNRGDNDDIWLVKPDGTALHPWVQGDGEKGDPQWSPDGNWIAYTQFRKCEIEIWIAPIDGGEPRLIVKGGDNQAPRWSPDGSHLLFWHSAHNQPGNLWIKSIEKNSTDDAIQLTKVSEGQLETISFSTPTCLQYISKDGLTIEGLYYPSLLEDNNLAPAILWVHGGPNAKHVNTWYPLLQYLAQRGYAIFAPNYRGSTGYGRFFMEANIGAGVGGDIEDWVASAKLLREMPSIDGNRIAIAGPSAGGYAAQLVLGMVPDEFKAGISISGISEWFSYWEDTEITWTHRFRVKLMGEIAKNQALYRARSPLTYVKNISAPMLLLHGADDNGVPPGQSLQMANALKSLGKTGEIKIYPEEGHGFVGEKAITDAAQRIETFLGLYL